jgi:hypothetical protein
VAFATTDDLATRLGRTLTSAEEDQASALLDDATAHLQELIGQKIEQDTVIAHLFVTDARVQMLHMPQHPVTTVTEVKIAGDIVTDYTTLPHGLWREDGWIDGAQSSPGQPILVTVAHTYGYGTVPGDLKSWACVLASQAMGIIEKSGVMGSGAVQSEKIDDYAVTYAQAVAAMSVPDGEALRLRSRYGSGVYVVGS